MIRYLQRVYKLDLEKIEKEILTDDLKSKVKAFGNGTYIVDKDFSIKICNNTVVTILES